MAASKEMAAYKEMSDAEFVSWTEDLAFSNEINKMIYDRMDENDPDRILFKPFFDFSVKKNQCSAMEIGKFIVCGKQCEDVFCDKHLDQIKAGLIPGMCKCCGVGVLASTYCKECIIGTNERW